MKISNLVYTWQTLNVCKNGWLEAKMLLKNHCSIECDSKSVNVADEKERKFFCRLGLSFSMSK